MIFMRIDVSVKGFLEDVWPGVEEIKNKKLSSFSFFCCVNASYVPCMTHKRRLRHWDADFALVP